MDFSQDPYSSFILLFGVLSLPFFVIASTSFIKVSVVLFIVRNALGVQQAPPNMALYTIAFVLSVFIMAPVANETMELANGLEAEGVFDSLRGFLDRGGAMFEPIRAFMFHNTEPQTLQAFSARAQDMWPESFVEKISLDSNFLVVVPAFVISELTLAFEAGILVYLPFIIVDLVVANVLTALGMMMVSPAMISLPFKLLLFVLIDGWFRLSDGLILSYA